MKPVSHTEKRVAERLKKMRTAMPEIKRQIEVYEKNIKSGKRIATPQTPTNFGSI